MAFSVGSSLLQPGVALLVLMGTTGCSSAPGDASASGNAGSANTAATGPGGSNTGGSGSSTGGSSTGGSSASASEFPCDVQMLLAQKCQACHNAEPPGRLLTSADFRKPSLADPQRTVGELAVERLSASGALRMPPAPLAAASTEEIAALTGWVRGGAISANCDQSVTVAPNPYDTPLICSSMTNWTHGNQESPLMRPGGACIKCHQQEGEGPAFAFAGTLYPTPHEPDDCNGVASALGAKVIVTDAKGVSHTMSVNGAGNFFLETVGFAFPYQAKITYQGRERVMVAAQTNGDCNDCHSQDGRENAPGRIFLP